MIILTAFLLLGAHGIGIGDKQTAIPSLVGYMQFAAAAYRRFPCGAGFVNTCNNTNGANSDIIIASAFMNPNTTQAGYVALSKSLKQIIVAFKGTNSLKTAQVDFDIIKEPYFLNKSVSIHRGFQQAYLGLRDYILPTVEQLSTQNPTFEIIYTGHSLGGALASIGANDFVVNGVSLGKKISVITFGCPKIGDAGWARNFDALPFVALRVKNFGDPIPRVPPKLVGFEDTGVSVQIKDGKEIVCDLPGTEPCLSDRKALSFNNHRFYLNISTTCLPELLKT